MNFLKNITIKLLRKLDIEDDDLKDIIAEITHLNPRPGNSEGDNKGQMSEVVPDFNISVGWCSRVKYQSTQFA
jgi:RNA polymerase sigma-54 factor